MISDFQILELLRKLILKHDDIENMLEKSTLILPNIDKSDFETAMDEYQKIYSTYDCTQFIKWIYAKIATNSTGTTLYTFLKEGNTLDSDIFTLV